MKKLFRHKQFIKDMRTVRLTDGQASKLFIYVARILFLRFIDSCSCR